MYLLPFDHRGSFQAKMFGWEGRLTTEQTAEIAAAKRVIYDGFTAALAAGVPRDEAGILVDEQFGAAWRAGKTTREEAVAEIARRYKEFVDTFETARALSATRTE